MDKQKKPVELVCQLSTPNQPPRFKSLTLAFGLSDDSYQVDSVTVRLSVYKDGNFYQSQTVAKGDKIIWPIDVQNTRNLALEAECISSQSSRSCPGLYFFEDVLQ